MCWKKPVVLFPASKRNDLEGLMAGPMTRPVFRRAAINVAFHCSLGSKEE